MCSYTKLLAGIQHRRLDYITQWLQYTKLKLADFGYLIKNRFVSKSLALANIQLRLYCNWVCWWPLATTTATVTILPTQDHHIPLLLGCENIWKHFSFPQAPKWRAPQSSLYEGKWFHSFAAVQWSRPTLLWPLGSYRGGQRVKQLWAWCVQLLCTTVYLHWTYWISTREKWGVGESSAYWLVQWLKGEKVWGLGSGTGQC